MRLEDLKNELPKTPDFIHKMICEEVEKQISEVSVMEEKTNKKWSLSKVAAVVLVCACASSSVVYAGTKLYHMYSKQEGTYSVKTGIESAYEDDTASKSQSAKTVNLPEEIPDIEFKANFLPNGYVMTEEWKWSSEEAPSRGGFSIFSALLDQEGLSAVLQDKNVVESEEMTFGEYDGVYLKYNDLGNGPSFNQRIYLLCPKEYRVITVYIGNDVSKEDAVKFVSNLEINETDAMVKTADMYTWSEEVNPEKETVEDDSVRVVAEDKLPIHKPGESISFQTWSEDANGNDFFTDKVSVQVDDVKIADDLQLLDSDKIPEEWRDAVAADGSLVKNQLSYVISGDGVNTIDKVLRKKDENQKLVYATVTYTNNSDAELKHILYIGSLELLNRESGNYYLYDEYDQSGDGYDRIVADGVAHVGEMTYYSLKEDYGNGGNYISSLKPGESIQVNMAWIVNEKDLENLYFNPNGNVYAITPEDMQTGLVFIGTKK